MSNVADLDYSFSKVESAEKHLQGLKEQFELRNAVVRLMKNADFKKVIFEQFCTIQCARYAQESGDSRLPAENRADSLSTAQAAGHLRNFLHATIQLGDVAYRGLEEAQTEVELTRAEENE